MHQIDGRGESPGSMHDIAAHTRPFQELLVHAMTKAAVFLPLDLFAKGIEPPSCSTMQQLLVSGDRFVLGRMFPPFSRFFSAIFEISFHRAPPLLCPVRGSPAHNPRLPARIWPQVRNACRGRQAWQGPPPVPPTTATSPPSRPELIRNQLRRVTGSV